MDFKNRNVVLLTGKSSSGKDTVCKIMNLFVYGGYSRSEICDMYKKNKAGYLSRSLEVHGRFAKVPYAMASRMLGVSFDEIVKHRVKDSRIEDGVFAGRKPRDVVKWLAESAKKEFGDDIWAKLTLKGLDYEIKRYPLVVVSDLRFLSEYKTFEHLNPIVVRVDRYDGLTNEADVDKIMPEYIVENKGGLDDLVDSVEVFLRKFNFLPSDWVNNVR